MEDALGVLDMRETLGEEIHNMPIVQGVVHVPPLLARTDQAHVAESPELVGDG